MAEQTEDLQNATGRANAAGSVNSTGIADTAGTTGTASTADIAGAAGAAGTTDTAGTAETPETADAEDVRAVIDAALEPHEPAPGETEARDRVRAEATGMTHRQAAAALERALAAAGGRPGADASVRAAVAEWQRVTDLTHDHGGPYSPDTDPYVQGQLTARARHRDPR